MVRTAALQMLWSTSASKVGKDAGAPRNGSIKSPEGLGGHLYLTPADDTCDKIKSDRVM